MRTRLLTVTTGFALGALATGCAGGTPSAPRAAGAATSAAVSTPVPTPVSTSPAASPSPAMRVRTTPSTPYRPVMAPPAAVAAPPRTATAARRYAFPVRGCRVSYAHSHHDYPATDILAPRGCAVVSPVSGRVDEVSTVDRWDPRTNRGADRGGLSFSVVGDDGVRYYGSHLSRLSVRAGQRVVAGQLIGAVGTSGDARGTASHLHFGLSWPTRPGIWWVRRGEVYPWPYLDSWRAGGSRSPAAEVTAAHRRSGDVPPCRIDC